MKRLLKIAVISAVVAVGLVLLGYVAFEGTLLIAESSLPDVVSKDRFDREIWNVSRVYSRDGRLLQEYFKERRTVVDAEQLPPHLLEAVVAAEDKNFFQHDGVDWLAVARAVVVDSVRGRFVQGASTLTQQLARNLYLSREKTISRKLKEALLARKMERTLSKRQILHQYVNLIYWGHGRYGVKEAAQFYFGKDARDLSLAESALLAGIIKGPEVFSPVKNPEKAAARMDYVLRQMAAADFISSEQISLSLPVIFENSATGPNISPYGTDAALVELFKVRPRNSLDTAGYTLVTTIDPQAQEAMNRGVSSRLKDLNVSLEIRRDRPETLCQCITDDRIAPGCPVWARVIKDSDSREGVIVDVAGRLGLVPYDALDVGAGASLERKSIPAGSYIRAMPATTIRLDTPWLTEETTIIPLIRPQVAAVLLDADSGAVLALYGGIDHRYHPYNRAITARRQIGSTIKPFLYLAAMETLGWDGERRVDATALDLGGPDGGTWRIRDGHGHSPFLPIEEALALSSNCAAVRTLRAVGVDAFLERWRAWGLPEPDTDDLSIALGSASMSPLQLASAYALLANGRCAPKPFVLRRLLGRDGKSIPLPALTCAGDVPSAVAEELTGMMEAVVERGTGKEARLEHLTIAGKTGTTTGGRDAWFAGIVRRGRGSGRVLVVWVGSDDSSPMEGNSGPTTAAGLWKAIAEELFPRR